MEAGIRLLTHKSAFRAPRPGEHAAAEKELELYNPSRHVYSRYTQDVSTRAEHILGKVNVRPRIEPYLVVRHSPIPLCYRADMLSHIALVYLLLTRYVTRTTALRCKVT
jgi:hypothetical protein